MHWLEVTVVTDGEGAEAVAEALQPHVHKGGVVIEQLGDTTCLDPEALEPIVTVKGYVPGNNDSPALRRRIEEVLYHLGRLYPLPAPSFTQLEEEDWANAWKAHYQPFRIGQRLWIQPSWLEIPPVQDGQDGLRPSDIVLSLDPGMAFGTGTHPTTQMCLKALEQWLQSGTSLLDVGTGSAILAIAGAKLGARRVLGVDTDELAVKTALTNIIQNKAQERIEVRQGTLAVVTESGWDVVVVNILAPVIISLLGEGKLLDYLVADGYLILGGIIDQQVGDVRKAIASEGGEVFQTLNQGDWVTLVVRHPLAC